MKPYPFVTRDGDLEEHDLSGPMTYAQVARIKPESMKVRLLPPQSDDAKAWVELFKREDLSFRIKNNYANVVVYVSEDFGWMVKKDKRDGFVQAHLKQMAPFLFTYGTREIHPGPEPVTKDEK